ncbi:MAG: CPBP family intramembrane glutamic endopeptidase [Acidobacteriota bacterium]
MKATPVEERSRGRAWLALLFLVPVPSFGTLAGLHWWPGPLGQALYLASKIWLLAFPLFWLLKVERSHLGFRRPSRAGWLAGLAQGLLLIIVMLAGFALFGSQLVDPATVQAQASENRLNEPLIFLGFFLYICLVNSLIEEIVWRGFVGQQWLTLVGRAWAPPLSALCFTIHHTVALSLQMGWVATALGSLGVFVGGMLWSWLYQRYDSLWPGWVSHVGADIAVAVMAWQLIMG